MNDLFFLGSFYKLFFEGGMLLSTAYTKDLSKPSVTPPSVTPKRPFFCVGPCAKPDGWSASLLKEALVGRSHRSQGAVDRLAYFLNMTKEMLQIPDDYKVAMVPGSATGAMETLLWSLLGARTVDVVSYDVFGHLWLHDIVKELKINHHVYEYPLGQLPTYQQENPHHDVVCVWNGSSVGVQMPNASFLHPERDGLVILDVTSAVYGIDIPWKECDAAAWSWQKGIGGEAGFGMIALSPRALERLRNYIPDRPIPRLFRLAEKGVIQEDLFRGISLNTFSLLALEDAILVSKELQRLGTLNDYVAHAQTSLKLVEKCIEERDYLQLLIDEEAYRSPTTIAFTFSHSLGFSEEQSWSYIAEMCKILDEEGIAFDIKGHKLGVPCFRVWGGMTVHHGDLEALFPWLDYAYNRVVKS